MKYKNVFIVPLAALAFALALAPANVWAQTTEKVVLPVIRPEPPPVEKTEPKEEEGGHKEEEDRQEFVDPREIRDVLRQIKDQKREAQRTLKKATKANLTAEISQLNEILAQVSSFETSFKNSGAVTRDTMQDFYDAQLWDSMNNIRIRVEMPNEIKSIERELKKVEKMVSRKNFIVEGIDMGKVNAKIAEIRGAIDQAKNSLAQGNLEDAQESMQVIYEDGGHPGEIMGVLNGLSEITKQFKRIKSEDIQNDIKEILAPVFEAVDSGDFREARMSFQEIEQDLRSIMNSLRNRSSIDSKMRERMDRLEEKLQQKFNQEENEKKGGKEDMGSLNTKNRQAYYDYRNYTASVLTRFLDFIGW